MTLSPSLYVSFLGKHEFFRSSIVFYYYYIHSYLANCTSKIDEIYFSTDETGDSHLVLTVDDYNVI